MMTEGQVLGYIRRRDRDNPDRALASTKKSAAAWAARAEHCATYAIWREHYYDAAYFAELAVRAALRENDRPNALVYARRHAELREIAKKTDKAPSRKDWLVRDSERLKRLGG